MLRAACVTLFFIFAAAEAAVLAKLTAAGVLSSDLFGSSISVNDDFVLVGAPSHATSSVLKSGAAFIFYRNQNGTNGWGLRTKLTCPQVEANDQFGTSVSFSDNNLLAVIGAPFKGPGWAFVYERDADGIRTWGYTAALTGIDTVSAEFGSAIATSGNCAVVGAPNIPSASIFCKDYPTSNAWGMLQRITSNFGTAPRFGGAVAFGGDNIAIGASFTYAVGSVHIFSRVIAGNVNSSWTPITKLTSGQTFDFFGVSVAFSGTTLVVGAQFADSNMGAVYVYQQNLGGVNAWGLLQKIAAADNPSRSVLDYFGASVAITPSLVLSGCLGDDTAFGVDAGSVDVYWRNETGLYARVVTLQVDDGVVNNRLGQAVAATNSIFAISSTTGVYVLGGIQKRKPKII